MIKNMDPKMVAAISHAVHAAIAAVGQEGLMRTSMFPSAAKRIDFKIAA